METTSTTSVPGGFATSAKNITLPILATITWVLTGLSYSIVYGLAYKPCFHIYSLTVSLGLSIIFGLITMNRLLQKTEVGTRVILSVINILLIYTSANGIQAGYCFTSKQEKGDTSNCQNASMIPFIIAKPWLPALIDRERIETDQKVIHMYQDSVANLRKQILHFADSQKQIIINKYIDRIKEVEVPTIDPAAVSDLASCQNTVNDLRKMVQDERTQNAALSAYNDDLSGRLNRANTELEEARSQLKDANAQLGQANAQPNQMSDNVNQIKSKVLDQWCYYLNHPTEDFNSRINNLKNATRTIYDIVGVDLYSIILPMAPLGITMNRQNPCGQ